MMALLKPLLLQSLRTGGLYLLLIALSLAISATTALKFSHDQINQAVNLQAAQLLAADMVVSDQQPIDERWSSRATQQGLTQSNVTVFSSMAHTDQQFVMVNVKAIDQDFPLRGRLEIEPASSALKTGQIWLSPRAMELLKVKLGDSVAIADGEFEVSGVIEHDANQELGFSGFSPTVMISQSDVARTNAVQVGSRIEYRLLLAGEPAAVDAFKTEFEAVHGKEVSAPGDAEARSNEDSQASTIRLRTAAEGNSRLLQPIEQLNVFLQLANNLTILLCGIAIALTSQRYVQQNQDHIALIRCLGATRAQIIWAYIGLLFVVSVFSILIGMLVGVVLGYGLLQLMAQLIPQLQLSFSLLSFLTGPLPIAVFTSVVVLMGFVLPSIWELLNVPPNRVIREQSSQRRSFFIIGLSGILSLALFSVVLTDNIQLSATMLAAILALSLMLYGFVYYLLKVLKQLKNRISTYVRTPAHTALQITALALGLSLITVLSVLRGDLLDRWQQNIPEGTPNQFVYGLPPFDMPEFARELEAHQWPHTALYPNIRGRLLRKNEQAFSQEMVEQNNALRRELNLTQAAELPEDNIITQGEARFTGVNQVSVEANLATELGIQVGDELEFSLPEGLLKTKVTSLRQVKWESFSPNFFFIFSPQTMDENAGSYLGSFYVPPEDQSQLIGLIQHFSNTVFIDVSLILAEIKNLINVLVQIISLLAFLVGISGVLVLIACLNLLMDERRREVALMRAFGVSKARLKTILSLEVGLIGLFAGFAACLFAELISAVASYKMELPLQWHPMIWLTLPLAMMIICAIIGRYRLSYLAERSPLESLREISSS